MEVGETFAEAAEREFYEETSIRVRALSAAPVIHPPDQNATPQPVPFYVDREVEGFSAPALVQFFFVEPVNGYLNPRAELEEIDRCEWFGLQDLDAITTFDQVRSLARWVLEHHPSGGWGTRFP